MKAIDTAIIIVNWNGQKLLYNCFESLQNQTYKNFIVYFVDNGSTDGSVKFINNNYPDARIIKLKKNTGFAYANNIGIISALKNNHIQYIITLNNDTKAEPHFVANLIAASKCNRDIGSVAPKIKLFYENNLIDGIGITINRDGGGENRGHKELDMGQYDNREEVFGVSAGAALYTRALLEDVAYQGHYFDNTFFAYYEDLDLAWRARLKGWKSLACPEAVVYHVHSATGGQHSPFKSFYIHRNRFFVMIKNFPIRLLISAFYYMLIRYFNLVINLNKKDSISYELKRKMDIGVLLGITLKAWISFLSFLPSMIIKRSMILKNRTIKKNKIISYWFDKFSKMN